MRANLSNGFTSVRVANWEWSVAPILVKIRIAEGATTQPKNIRIGL